MISKIRFTKHDTSKVLKKYLFINFIFAKIKLSILSVTYGLKLYILLDKLECVLVYIFLNRLLIYVCSPIRHN